MFKAIVCGKTSYSNLRLLINIKCHPKWVCIGPIVVPTGLFLLKTARSNGGAMSPFLNFPSEPPSLLDGHSLYLDASDTNLDESLLILHFICFRVSSAFSFVIKMWDASANTLSANIWYRQNMPYKRTSTVTGLMGSLTSPISMYRTYQGFASALSSWGLLAAIHIRKRESRRKLIDLLIVAVMLWRVQRGTST